MAIQARQSRSIFCMDCMYPLSLARQLGSVGGEACLLASERQLEYILSACMCRLQQYSDRKPCLCTCANFRSGVEESYDPLCLPVPVRGTGECCNNSCSLILASAMTVHPCCSYQGGWRVLYPGSPPRASRLSGERSSGVCQCLHLGDRFNCSPLLQLMPRFGK